MSEWPHLISDCLRSFVRKPPVQDNHFWVVPRVVVLYKFNCKYANFIVAFFFFIPWIRSCWMVLFVWTRDYPGNILVVKEEGRYQKRNYKNVPLLWPNLSHCSSSFFLMCHIIGKTTGPSLKQLNDVVLILINLPVKFHSYLHTTRAGHLTSVPSYCISINLDGEISPLQIVIHLSSNIVSLPLSH